MPDTIDAMLQDFRLKVFVTVAQEKSFSKAAEILHVTQPAVSQHVSELEKATGVKLFDRLRSEVLLTPAGEMFKSYADDILMRYYRMNSLFDHFPEITVRVSASDEVYAYLTEDLLAGFLTFHPEVHLVKSFLAEEADLTVTLTPAGKKRGMLALGYHPSVSFAASQLWQVLSDTLEPTL